MKFKIALVQMNVVTGEKEQNMAAVTELAAKLPGDCDFLVLPELWNIGYDIDHIKEKAETAKGESIVFLRSLAKKYHVNIIGGSVAEKHNRGCYNMLPYIDRDGNLLHKYRKVHLFPLGLKEHTFFDAGDEWGIFRTNDITIGAMLCYDLRFPAFCRNLSLQQASIIFVPAQWPEARIAHFRLLAQARAVENEVFVVAVNRIGSDTIDYNGNSLVVAPDGRIVLDCGEEEGLFICEIDTETNDFWQNQIPVYSDRKNILDEIDNNLF